jgi:hypothetical protein
MRRCGYIITIAVLLLCSMKTAMAQNRNTLSINGDHLTLQIDLRSPKKLLDSILNAAGVSITNSERIFKGDFTALYNDGWSSTGQQNNIVRFDKSLDVLNENPQNDPYVISLQIPQLDGKPGYPAEVKYGVNKFAKATVYELPSGLTRFMLPGFTNVKRVFLSGSFNSWSTLKGLMKKIDGGWVLDIKLEAGVHQYKYIIGGNWSTDHNNLLEADDGAGNTNSVYFKYNYTFKLKGYTNAHQVMVSGDFNKWDPNELAMEKVGDTWLKHLYLSDGKHDYRFWVDDKWITDPANRVKEKGAEDNNNSIINLGETVYFKLKGFAGAKKVYVAGNFNDWKPNDLRLAKSGDAWVLPYVLTAGNYDYKFIVDGRWITDPQNSNYAVEKGETNSFLSVKPNHVFKLKGYKNARSVRLTGTFDNWDTDGYTLSHKGDEWTISLYLKPGKYLYKFIVDGQRILDPGNKLWEPGDNDTSNSVLWLEQGL